MFDRDAAARLLNKMRTIYGAKFDKQWANVEPDELLNTMVEMYSDLTASEFKRGLDALQSHVYCPSLPEFKALCRPNGLSDIFPPPRAAYQAACNHRYPHEVVYEAASRVGFYELESRAESSTFKSFEQEYKSVCDEYLAGKRFTMPVARQVTHESKPADPERAAEYIAKIKEQIGFFKQV